NPFAAPTPSEIVRAHFTAPPPVRASASVQAVVDKLLAREPRSRYAQADEVIEALAAATRLPLESEGEGLARDRIGLGLLQGREAELARIEAAAQRVAGGRGAHLLLVGPAGSGRSRLLRECGVVAELAGVRTLHLEQGTTLTTLCRWLGILVGVGTPLEPSVGAARERLIAACAQHPLALLVDDADRAKDWLCALVLALARDPAWKQRPLLVVAVSSHQIDPSLERVELRPLAPAQVKAKAVGEVGARSWGGGLAGRLVGNAATRSGCQQRGVIDAVDSKQHA